MKNITLALAIALGFCATEAVAQARVEPQASPEEIQERQLWSTWPKDVKWYDATIVKKCEEELGIVFWGAFGGARSNGWTRKSGICLVDVGWGDQNSRYEWRRGGEFCWKKYNAEGVMVKAGDRRDFEEFIWLTNCAAIVTAEFQKKWSCEHGMSYEEAVRQKRLRTEEAQAKRKLSNLSFKAKQEAEREKQIIAALQKVCAAEKAKEEK